MINVLAPTSQFGINVFEGIRCYWNEQKNQLYCFRLDDHINRLIQSAKLMHLDLPYNFEEIKQSVFDVIDANNYQEDIALRVTIFLDGEGSWFANSPTDMFVAPIPSKILQSKSKIKLRARVSSWTRISDNSMSPRTKVGANYVNSRVGQLEAVRDNYDTTLFLTSSGKISEAPGACVMIVRGGEIITPPVTASILESITRNSIFEIAREELDVNYVERDIDRTELYISEEMFLCGTAVEIKPIVEIDNFVLNSGKIGAITNQLYELYSQIVRNEITGYERWLTKII